MLDLVPDSCECGIFKLSRTENIHDLVIVVELRAALDELLHLLDGSLHGAGDLVNVLGLDDGLQVILQNLGEVVWFMLARPELLRRRALSNSLCNSEPRKYFKISSQSGGLS